MWTSFLVAVNIDKEAYDRAGLGIEVICDNIIKAFYKRKSL
jgi:hypothetical protein